MQLINWATTQWLAARASRVRRTLQDPAPAQRRWLSYLIEQGRRTEYGRRHGLDRVRTYEDFAQALPIVEYEQLWEDIERAMHGHQDVLWPGRIGRFSKSSGTTQQRSKYIPVTRGALTKGHYRAGQDLIALYLDETPGSRVLYGKTLSIGGSLADNPGQSQSVIGDVSALIMNDLPGWAQRMRFPPLEVALLADWEEKIERIAQLSIKENITSLSGVPTWIVLVLKRVMALADTDDIRQVWPNLELFLHGAVSFAPYRELFDSFVKSGPPLRYQESYNASEGFFAAQDQVGGPAGQMALLPDHGVFYEFIPMSDYRRGSERAVPLWAVEPDVEYAIVITTNAGLWRYVIGDTVRFVDPARPPYRIMISGRTRHFINAFGEEVVVENAEAAVARACHETGAALQNYTVAPVYMEGGRGQASHEWVVEFETPPDDLTRFTGLLDEHLRQINSDYDAKRHQDMALRAPRLVPVPSGTFYKWLASKGKLGGQHKVPRLANSRQIVEEVLALAGQGPRAQQPQAPQPAL